MLVEVLKKQGELTLKWWMRASMLSFMEARGGGTSLLSSTLTTPVGILFKHYDTCVGCRSEIRVDESNAPGE